MAKKSEKKPPLYFYLILMLIPILFFLLIEAGLHFFEYGFNTDAFIDYPETNPDLYFVNADLPYRYVSGLSTPPAVSLDAFKKVKTDSTFRIFVMGGSSAAGFPYAYNATFPKYIERKLKKLYPEINIEVINLGITAHNSYTIADLADDVISQNPDLVIIYAGHNEYYGVLGVGSSASFGSSITVAKIMISLNQLKTYQLLRNFLAWVMSSLDSEDKTVNIENETLMSRMIGESAIGYDSETFNNGIEQFRINMREFIEEISNEEINILFGNIVSNLKQKPFVSLSESDQLNADSLFSAGLQMQEEENFSDAKDNFHLAKEYDALRFRAPEKINEIIEELCSEYNIQQVDIKSAFESTSKNQIIGYNLMVDHLHPNIDGYNLIGEKFFKAMKDNNFLPDFEPAYNDLDYVDSLLADEFPFTQLDSLISELRLKKLLGSFPFVEKGKSERVYQNFRPKNLIDTLVISVLSKRISWRSAHQELAQWYFNNKEYDKFIKEMKTIIAYQPYAEIPYAFAASRLINIGKFEESLFFLEKVHKLNPNDYTYKWLGSIALQKGDYDKAVRNLVVSAKLNNKDAQVYYNLSGAYFNKGMYKEAIEAIEYCLKLKPNYPQAKQFYNALKNAYGDGLK
jgi:tetratricopeptide (TPR) repeat protein